MTIATLEASMTRLENIKGSKHLHNKNKIAEAEALAAEALRMANEAKMAAARLAEVKKTLSMFSSKLEKAELSVQKDVKVKVVPVVAKESPTETSESVIEEPTSVETPDKEAVEAVEAVEDVDGVEAPVEEEPAGKTVEKPTNKDLVKSFKNDPPTASSQFVSKNLVNDDVVKVFEYKQPFHVTSTKDVTKAPKEPVDTRETPAPFVAEVTHQHDIVEDFLDSLGVDKMCGVDDRALGFTDRQPPPAPAPAPAPKIFENPTRIQYKILNHEEFLHGSSLKETFADLQRQKLQLPPKQFQRALVNEEFADPFGVDHDDLVLCGKIADLCEPPSFEDGGEY